MREHVEHTIEQVGQLTRTAPYAAIFAGSVILLAAGAHLLMYFDSNQDHEREQLLIHELSVTREQMMIAVKDQRMRNNELLTDFIKATQAEMPTRADSETVTMLADGIRENANKIDRLLIQLDSLRVQLSGKGR